MAASVRGGAGASSTTSGATGGIGGAGALIGARFSVLAGQAVTGAVGGGGGLGTISQTAPNNGTGTANGGSSGTVGVLAPATPGPTIHRGGGGGGSSSISVGGLKLIEAGGGGGGGGAHQSNPIGNGGGGGFSGIVAGGVAAGLNGNVGSPSTVGGGQGGQVAAGGAGGVGPTTYSGVAGLGIGTGTGGRGGNDAASTDSGGGGGGGYTGGGGGGSNASNQVTGGGGGGGSSFVRANSPTAATSATTGVTGAAGIAPAAGFVVGPTGFVTIDWIPCQYALALSKTASVTNVNAGAKTVWTITVRNDGPDPMTKGDVVTLTDTLPAGPIGAPTPQFKVLSIGTSGGSNANMASGAVTCTGLTVGGAMPASTVCSRPYAAVAAVPGAPSGGTRGLNSGETLTITYEQVFANTAAAASITNTATVVDRSTLSTGSDITGTNATRTASATVNVVPYNLRISKSASSTNINAGGTITWTVVVTNDGPGAMYGPDDTTANALTVSDIAPTANVAAPTGFSSSGSAGTCGYSSGTISCTGSLGNGQSQTFTFNQVVSSTAPGGSTIENTATVTDYATGDTDDSQLASVAVSPSANLSIDKSDGVSSAISGSTVTYTVIVTNDGPDSTTGAVVTDIPGAGITCASGDPVVITGSGVPAGSFTISNLIGAGITLGTLANGQSATLTYSCKVN